MPLSGMTGFGRAEGAVGDWTWAVEARSVTPGIRVREDVPNESSDLVLALDGVQLAWAQPHGRAVRWVPNP